MWLKYWPSWTQRESCCWLWMVIHSNYNVGFFGFNLDNVNLFLRTWLSTWRFFWEKKSSYNLKKLKNKSGFLKVLIVIFVFKCTSNSGFTGVYNSQAFCKNSSNYFVWLVCGGHYHSSFLFTDHLVCVCCMLMLKMLSYWNHLVLWIFPINVAFMSFTLSLHWSISQSMHVLSKHTSDREWKGTGNSVTQALVFIFHQLWWWYTIGS